MNRMIRNCATQNLLMIRSIFPETHQTPLPAQSFQTPPSQTYVPGQHNYSPYPKSSHFKNLHSSPGFGACAPPTPVKGLTTQEVKSMSKVWNSPAKFVEVVIAAISVYTGISVDEGQVTDILKALLELTLDNKSKTFSVLTKSDQEKMVPKGFAGRIRINLPAIPKDFPEEFYVVLTVLRRTLSRELEAGCRPIIAYFLAFAVDRAREMFKQERLVVHSEVPIPNVQIPEVGLVGGTLDFMTADVIGEAPMEEMMVEEDGHYAKVDPEKSIFIVVVAKRTSKLPDASSEAELIGQLKSQLIRSRTTSHIGALTDGKSWRFYYIVQDKFYHATMVAGTKEETSLVLGMLTLFSAGKFPTTEKTAATWVQGDLPSANRTGLI